jgi:hypothetical protein
MQHRQALFSKLLITVTSLISLVGSLPAAASSCCGQSPASFSILSLNQRLSLTTSYSYTQAEGRVFNQSDEFYIWDDKDREVQSLGLNVATSFGQRHQAFINASAIQGHYRDDVESGTSQHLSDTLIGYSYEALPEYSFSYWKPIIYITALVNLPTGHSIYDDSELSEGTDVTGHNQWGTGAGLTLKKVYFPLTLTLQAKTLRLWAKTFAESRVSGFYDSSVALLASYATRLWSLQINTGITWNHLSERTLETSNVRSGESQSYTALVGLQRPLNDDWGVGVNYSDQTLIGPAKNTLLNRSMSLSLNYNYF